MEFRVLGPLEVSDGARALPLGGLRQRLVLGVLLLRADRPVTTDWLVDAVWGEYPPRTARKTLQVYISRLRSALGPNVIAATATGYTLRLSPDDVDSARFERLADEGRLLLATDPTAAARVLREALSLWRGMPWGDLGDEPALQPEAQRLRERRLAALEDRITADLAMGHAAPIIGELEGLVDEHPWRERFRAQLMLALYRCGRQSEALRVFQAARRFLGEELGIDPSPELQDLEEKILLQDPEIAGPVAHVELEDWRLARNPYKGLRPFRREDSADFFGRSDLVDTLIHRLAASRFLAVVGASGSGKSSLVMAGLIPQLSPEEWTVAAMLPGQNPFGTLRSALDALEGTRHLEPERGDDLDVLRAVQAKTCDTGPRLLLVIDQLEELFHQVGDETVRTRFLRNLVEAIEDPSTPVTVLVTLRADMLESAMDQSPLAELIGAGMVGVLPLQPHELEAAAARPAERAGVLLEPELIAELVGDMAGQSGALPLFQYVLTQLFEERSGPVLTRAAYRRIGGLAGALSRRAEQVYRTLDPDVQPLARQVFMRLVAVGTAADDSRRRAERDSLEALDTSGTNVKGVLDAFDEARLLTFDRNPVSGEATVEVAHEALLREWPRMRGWLDTAREDLRHHAALVAEVGEWENSGRDLDYLLTGSRLDLYEDWRADTSIELTAPEAAFLAASITRREEERAREDARRSEELQLERRSVRRLRALAVVVSIAALVAAGLTLFAANRNRQAAASQREAHARELANASLVNLGTDPELAILLALEAIDVTREADGSAVREAQEALHEAVGTHRLLQTGPGAIDVEFLPDGTVLSGGDGARLWNPATGDLLAIGLGEVASVAASPDGSMVATGGGSGTLVVWDARTGDRLQSLTREGRPAHDRFINDLVFSSDDTMLASASGDVSGDQTVRVWDVAGGTEIVSVDSPEGAMWNILGQTPQLAFHPDGTQLAITGFSDEAARILDLATGEWAPPLVGPDSPARAVEYFAAGSRIATSTAYGSIGIWDAATARHLFSVALESQNLRLQHLEVSADGSMLAAAGGDGVTRVWNLLGTAAQPAMTLAGSDIAFNIDFSPDGSTLATVTTDRVELWDITPGGRGEFAALEGEASMIAFSPDGTRLAVRSSGDVVVLDTTSWERQALLDHPGSLTGDLGPTGLAWSPDGDRIVTAFAGGEVLVGPGFVRVWDAATGAVATTLSRTLQPHGDIVLRANGRVAAAICQRSADGVSWESAARVWDATSGEELFAVPITDCADAVDLDPEGGRLAVQVEGSGEVQVWDVDTAGYVGAAPHNPGSGGATRFSPNGGRLLTAGHDGTVRVWDLATFEPLVVLDGHSGPVTEAIWGPDGATIITGGADGTVRLWDARSGASRLVLSGHRGAVLGVSLSPDGTRLATSGTDGVVRVWAIDLDDLIDIARSRLSRTLTGTECALYHVEDCPPSS